MSLVIVLLLLIFLSVVHHVVELLSLLRAKVPCELSINVCSLQVLILLHVMDHHSDVILAFISHVLNLGTINYPAKAPTLGSTQILRLVGNLSRFLIKEESSSSIVHELFQN